MLNTTTLGRSRDGRKIKLEFIGGFKSILGTSQKSSVGHWLEASELTEGNQTERFFESIFSRTVFKTLFVLTTLILSSETFLRCASNVEEASLGRFGFGQHRAGLKNNREEN